MQPGVHAFQVAEEKEIEITHAKRKRIKLGYFIGNLCQPTKGKIGANRKPYLKATIFRKVVSICEQRNG